MLGSTFSILLPTYNRSDILSLAIQSVLNQDFDDFELIISNGGSTDNTHDVVSGFSDPRIRYWRSESRLSMTENYDFALSKANGEYIIFFSDDDAFVPSMLQKVKSALEKTGGALLIFPFAHYYHESQPESSIRANTLSFATFTGQVKKVKAADDIRRMSGRFFLSPQPADQSTTRPLIGNVVFRREILSKIYQRTDSLFSMIPVDGYFITLVLGVIDEYYVLDQPLLAWSQWEKNSSVSTGKNLRYHYEQLLNGKGLDQVPLKFALPVNCAANAILQANEDIGGRPELPLDWKWYYLKMFEYLLALDVEGVDTTRELAEFNTVLANEPTEVVDFVQGNMSQILRKHWLKKRFKSVVPHVRRISRMLSLLDSDNIVQRGFWGEEFGFRNVLESAKFLGDQLPTE